MKEVKIKSVGLAITASIVSGLSLFSWVSGKHFKGLSAIVFFSSSTAGLVTSAKSAMDERDVNEKLKRIVENIQREQSESEGLVQKSAGIVSRLNNELQTSQKQLEQVTDGLQATQTQLNMAKNAFNLKCQELAKSEGTKDTRFSHFLKEYTTKMGLLLVNSINQVYGSLLGKCDALLKRPEYANIHSDLEKFKASLEDPKKVHLSTAQEIGTYDIDSVTSLIDVTQAADEITTLTIQVMEELSAHKVRYRNMLNIDERRALQQYMDADPHKVTKQFARDILNQQSAYDKEVLQNLEAKINGHGEELERDRREFMEVLKQLESANERVAQLSQPIIWEPAITPAAKIGNIIIQFFHQQRIHLDRSHYLGDKHEATLYFHVTRINPTQRVDIKQLNEHGEYLAQLSHCLKPIEFAHDYEETHLLTAKVLMFHRPKKETAKSDVDKLWIPATKFESYVRGWERIRITAGSTGGKSPTAKNLALAIMKSRNGQGEIRLYDPQDGSKKDYWDMPKAGTSHAANVTGMEELCIELDTRSKSKANYPFVLYIFDEVDSTIAQERENNDYYYFKDKVTYSLKQASHQNIGVIYIGQACDASTIPGMSWSDWNNAVQVHIGANAGIWIDKAKTISGEDKTKLLEQYRKIQEFCDRQNKELGLDVFTDPGAYRFALVVPLTGLPKFIQLPDFDSYNYYDVMKDSTASTSAQSELLPNNSEWVEIKHPSELSQAKITCPKCGSINIGTKGTTFHRCRDCDKTWKK